MKRFIALFATIFALTACAGITIEMNKDPSSAVAIEILSRRLAYHAAIKYPAMIKPGIEFCNLMIGYEDPSHAKALLFDILGHIPLAKKDPLLMRDIEDLAELVNVKVDQQYQVDITPDQMKLLKLAADAFRTGLMLAKEKAGE